MADDNSPNSMFSKGPLLPIGPTSKIIGPGVAGSIICGYAAWIMDVKTQTPITYGAGEVSIWGCLVGGAAIGCFLGWLWARK
ncbi:MAG: hypothetical protein OSJ28_03575 [Desulfovibrio sp.]|nr:hypothetical protein [Desulfovibrio sp.]